MTIDIRNNTISKIAESGNQIEHQSFSTNFEKVEILQNGSLLVLENYYKYQHEEKTNLYFLDKNLKVEWFLATTEVSDQGLDYYVGFSVKNTIVVGHTWNGFIIETDIATQKIVNIEFVK